MSLTVPAVLPSSHKDLEEKLALLGRLYGISRIQIDVVDGKIAGPASWPYSGPPDLHTLRLQEQLLPRRDRIEYEIDLMCQDAEMVAGDWLALGATRLTFHTESANNPLQLLQTIRRRYCPDTRFAPNLISIGLALNSSTDPVSVESYLDQVEYVQFMGIAQIGQQGQPFDERVIESIRTFRQKYPDIPVQVDGGITSANARQLLALGVSNLVVGSAILRAADPAAVFANLEGLTSPYGV